MVGEVPCPLAAPASLAFEACTGAAAATAKVGGSEYGPTAGECIAHDVMAVAAERGWVEPLRKIQGEAYRLRVAK